jgi:hypothetical protein
MKTTLLLALAVAVLSMGVIRADDAIKPDDEGFIRTWLVLAPLPFEVTEAIRRAEKTGNGDELGQELAKELAKEQVPGEGKLRPKEGDEVKVGDDILTWKKHKGGSHLLDLNDFLGTQTEYSVAYAVCYLVAGDKLDNLTLKIGSDDQAKVYINGKEVLKSEKVRPADRDQDSAPVALDKGVNTIVFKISNWKYNWAGCLRFTDKDDKPIKNVEVRLKP